MHTILLKLKYKKSLTAFMFMTTALRIVFLIKIINIVFNDLFTLRQKMALVISLNQRKYNLPAVLHWFPLYSSA